MLGSSNRSIAARSVSRLLLVCLTLVLALGLIAGVTQGSMKTMMVGSKWAVSAQSPEAALVMAQILEKGGNAFDAAVAGQAVNGLTIPSMNSFGADCQVMIWHAGLQEVIAINGSGWAPKLATIDWYMKNNDGKIPASDGLLSGTVPAVFDAWCVMLSRWGTMSLEQVLTPALEMAEKGFALRSGIAPTAKLLKYPSSMESLFGHLPPGQEEWKTGDIFTWPDLARTWRKLIEAERANAHKGREAGIMAARDRFYKGDIAREMAEFSEKNGGLFRYEDFAEYSVEVLEPVSVNYRGYQVWNSPSASQGPTLLMWLSLLNGYDLKAMKQNSADYLHVMHETMKLAYADREAWLTDQNFWKIPYDVLLSEEYAAERRKLIDMEHADNTMRPGSVPGYPKRVAFKSQTMVAGDADVSEYYEGTSYLCVADKEGNMVSFKPSLHSSWGTGVVMGTTGVIFNCRGDYFSLDPTHVKALEPRKRPRSTLMATLITKDGKPFMVVGSPGGDDQPQREIHVIVGVIDFGLNPQDAIEAPRFASVSFPSSVFPFAFANPGRITIDGRVPGDVVEALKARGHDARLAAQWGVASALSAILRDPATGAYYAAADPRSSNLALAK